MKRSRPLVLLLADVASFHTQRFAPELARQGCRVVTASLEEGVGRHLRLKRLGPVRSFHYLLAVPQLKSIIKRLRPDIVNAHFASGYGFIAAEAVGSAGPPIVLNIWGSDVLVVPHKSPQHKLKTRIGLERAHCVIGDSDYIIEKATGIAALKQSRVIPWGIEREHLQLHRADYTLSRPLRIIVPRRHEEVYNNCFTLRSLRPLVEKGDVELTFPDFGSLTDQFKADAGRLLDNGVRLYSMSERGRFLAFMAEHDVYLSASRSDSSPASMIEAMALGLIPVAAGIDGVAEWLSDESGFAFQQDNADGLRDLIAGIVSSGQIHEDMRRSNLERVKQQAIFEDNIAEQVGIMKELIP